MLFIYTGDFFFKIVYLRSIYYGSIGFKHTALKKKSVIDWSGAISWLGRGVKPNIQTCWGSWKPEMWLTVVVVLLCKRCFVSGCGSSFIPLCGMSHRRCTEKRKCNSLAFPVIPGSLDVCSHPLHFSLLYCSFKVFESIQLMERVVRQELWCGSVLS